jgi:YVTN family beta-propeller protein
MTSSRSPFTLALGIASALFVTGLFAAQTNRAVIPTQSTLHNGWRLTPAGTHQKTGDMVIGGALSPDGKQIALVNAGYNAHNFYLTDATTGQVLQTILLKDAWNGIVWASDGQKIYVSGGGAPQITVLERQASGLFAPGAPILLPELKGDKERKSGEPQAYVSGLALSKDGSTLFAGNLATDTIYKINLADSRIQTRKVLDHNAHPYCLRLGPDGASLYVTQGALGSVAVLDALTLEVKKTLITDKHPNDIAFSPDGERLFVSCGNSDTVVVFDLESSQVEERIAVRLTPKAPAGAIPNALSITPDGKTLAVADAGNNCVALVDISDRGASVVRGFVPTAWYPTWVHHNGERLLVGSGKGMGTGPNSIKNYPNEVRGKEDPYFYIARQLYGVLSTLPTPSEQQLGVYTRQVLANTPYNDAVVNQPVKAPKPGTNPIPSRLGDASPIKNVLYIIKENRTYDQVLGDLEKGNGDKDLVLFGEKITPNLHQIAREFVTLDNTYCSGEVSGNGHPWSTSAYGTDIGERSWMMAYGDHADWALTDVDIFPPMGRIWDVAEREGLPFASYYFTWTTPNTQRNMSRAWARGFDKRRDYENANLYIADLKKWEKSGKMPRFAIMALREDHTEGTSPGKFTPRACVASNDLGVGKIIEALSTSRFWKETAVFIIQDDAQDGPDHVDAHRTTAFVVSPYTHYGKVDSTAYTTCSLLRTMELILGLPPMSEYDAAAPPMYNAFAGKPNLTPYTARPTQIDLQEKNPTTAFGAVASSKMDFSKPDQLTAAQVAELNRILWVTNTKPGTPYPGSIRSHVALLATSKAIHKDIDD